MEDSSNGNFSLLNRTVGYLKQNVIQNKKINVRNLYQVMEVAFSEEHFRDDEFFITNPKGGGWKIS